jgi:hypothetical protein
MTDDEILQNQKSKTVAFQSLMVLMLAINIVLQQAMELK